MGSSGGAASYTSQRRFSVVAGGWFAVGSKVDSDRLIYDRRPRNATEQRLRWADLPHGTMFVDIVLEPGFGLRGTAKDLRVWLFCIQQNHLVSHVAGRPWTSESLPGLVSKTGPHRLCLLIQGMGDLNSVDVAQLVDEFIFHNAGVLDRDTLFKIWETSAFGTTLGRHLH